jgi:hypothetical protein
MLHYGHLNEDKGIHDRNRRNDKDKTRMWADPYRDLICLQAIELGAGDGGTRT